MNIREAIEREIQRVENLSVEELLVELEEVRDDILSNTLAEISRVASSLNQEHYLHHGLDTRSVVGCSYVTQDFSGTIPLVDSHLIDMRQSFLIKSTPTTLPENYITMSMSI